MYLINTSSLVLIDFHGREKPPYAILSHTWGHGEMSFEQLRAGDWGKSAGHRKCKTACSLAAGDGWDWIWIDTCCIDKRSSTELSEAINSMYHWYSEAQVCYALSVRCLFKRIPQSHAHGGGPKATADLLPEIDTRSPTPVVPPRLDLTRAASSIFSHLL